MFPNPAADETRLHVRLESENKVALTIRDVIGKEIYSATFAGMPGENIIPFDVKNLTSGLYFITLESGDLKSTKRLIKQ
jgi:hypothetical protein